MDNMSNGEAVLDCDKNKKLKKKRKIRKEFIIIIVLLIGIVAIYLVGSFYFNKKFLNSTYINDVNVGGLTLNEANEMLSKTVDDHMLELKFNDGTSEFVSGKDLGIKYNTDNDIAQVLKKQNSFLKKNVYLLYMFSVCLYTFMPEEDIRFHYRWP